MKINWRKVIGFGMTWSTLAILTLASFLLNWDAVTKAYAVTFFSTYNIVLGLMIANDEV